MIVILLPAVTAWSNCVSESSCWVWCVYEYQSHIKNLDNGTHKVKPILISASRPVPRYSFSLSSSTPSGELSGLQCVCLLASGHSSILIEEDYLRGNRCFGSGDWNSPLKELFSFSSFLPTAAGVQTHTPFTFTTRLLFTLHVMNSSSTWTFLNDNFIDMRLSIHHSVSYKKSTYKWFSWFVY